MTDEVTAGAAEQAQQVQQQPAADADAAAHAEHAQAPAAAQAEPAPGMTLEEVEAKRNAENLARAKERGYVEPGAPSIGERVSALVAGVQHAMDHNAPMTIELFDEMKALLGHREPSQGGEAPKA